MSRRRPDPAMHALRQHIAAGDMEAAETVQLYVRQKVCRAGWRPVRELRGFEKVTLEPGERRRVTVEAALPVGDYEYFLASDSRADGVRGEVK